MCIIKKATKKSPKTGFFDSPPCRRAGVAPQLKKRRAMGFIPLPAAVLAGFTLF